MALAYRESKPRRKVTSEQKQAQPKLSHEEMLIVRISVPDEDQLVAEFRISAKDVVTLFLDKAVFAPAKSRNDAPNKKLAASLLEAKQITPRFTTAKELFNGLEKAVRS
jgi:hypothetical protein